MRRSGLWHPRLMQLIAAMGHTETIVIADAGLPVPPGVEAIDLVWSRGEPRMLPVLRAVLTELVVEQAVIANEARDPLLLAGIERELEGVDVRRVDHEELKRRCGAARAVVRTGEDTPYANVLLRAGVPF
jgi:D-ribose pyranase